jgi:hypothetical protein
MVNLKIGLPLTLGVALVNCPSARANPAFVSSEIEGPGTEMIFCDLDGDRLKDAVLMDGRNLSIFYQDSKQGFTRGPQQRLALDDRPAVVWPAKLGKTAESLLVMTSDGVTEFCFTNRTGPPARRLILHEPTIIPGTLDESKAGTSQVIHFGMSAETGTDWPLLLVPAPSGLQVWQHHQEWRRSQIIEKAVENRIQPSVDNPGYTEKFGLNLSLSDIHGGGREDLMVKRNLVTGMQVYALYLQGADGLFGPEPAMSYTNKDDWRTSLYWVDINRDGQLDLIKSTFLCEPSFVPWMPSGKVVVGSYLADQQGRIPAAPQQVFRKHDWSSPLPMVDVDGDGYVDLVLGYIPIDTREGLRKVVTTEKLDFTLKFHFFRPGVGFSKEPDCQRNLQPHVDRGFFAAPDNTPYFALDGDFNGDGKKDLLVRDHAEGISVSFFISREKGFSPEADLQFHCPEPIEWWEIRDLNGDGVSDLVVKIRDQNLFRIFTSPGK